MIPDLITEIERLRAENIELASRPCFECDVITPGILSSLRAENAKLKRQLESLVEQQNKNLPAIEQKQAF
jgi:predicted ester cyclase